MNGSNPTPSPVAPCELQYPTVGRTVLETLLCVAIIVAYVPQYAKIRREGTMGISPYYILNHGLFSTVTLALRISHGVFHPALNCIAAGELRGGKGYSASLGLVAVVIQWLCAAVLMSFYIRHRTTDPPPETIQFRWLSETHAHKLTSRRMIVALGAGVAATLPLSLFFLVAAPYFTTPPDAHHQHRAAVYTILGNIWVGLLCGADAFLVAFQFVKQIKTVGRLRTRGALSLASAALLSVVLVLLGVAQFFGARRNIASLGQGKGHGQGRPENMDLGGFVRALGYVYGCLSVPVMYVVAGLGHLVLLLLGLLFDWNDMFGSRFGMIQLL